jgi:hypothetical protein
VPVTEDTFRLTLDSSALKGVIKEPEMTLGAIVSLSMVFSPVKIGMIFSGIRFSFSITVFDMIV